MTEWFLTSYILVHNLTCLVIHLERNIILSSHDYCRLRSQYNMILASTLQNQCENRDEFQFFPRSKSLILRFAPLDLQCLVSLSCCVNIVLIHDALEHALQDSI